MNKTKEMWIAYVPIDEECRTFENKKDAIKYAKITIQEIIAGGNMEEGDADVLIGRLTMKMSAEIKDIQYKTEEI